MSIYFLGYPTKKKTLKRDSVPSMNLPELPKRGTVVKSPSKVAAARRRERILKKHKHQEETQSAQTIDREVAEILLHLHEARPLEPIERRLEIPLHIEIPETSSTDHQSAISSVSTQVTSGDFVAPFLSYINTEQVLNTLCGIPTFDILNFLCDEVSAIVVNKRLHKLTIKERVVLTLMKLKQNFSLRVLEILFKMITVSTCKKIFVETLAALAKVLKCAIPWPSKTEIKNKIPKCFQNFENVRIVLDCTEIPIQKPKCLACRIKLYSHYKSGLTLKFMTGVTPAGLITFTSLCYGGKTSDKAIFEDSKIMNLLEEGDSVMVDKGFLINSLCFQKGVKVIRPPFLRSEQQFSKEEALLNKEIARARVHIERSNQRIKLFKFFNGRYEFSYLNVVNEAFTVVCGLVNLCSPILANDKF